MATYSSRQSIDNDFIKNLDELQVYIFQDYLVLPELFQRQNRDPRLGDVY